MKEIKVNSTLVILIATLIFLFAGHFIYQSQFIEKPLREALYALPNASLQQVNLQPKNVRVIVSTSPGFSLKEYPEIRGKIQHIVGNRKVEIQVLDRPDMALEDAWQEMVLGVKEGLIINKYTQVRDTISKIAKVYDVKSAVMMDDDYLYIELRHNSSYLLRVYSLDKIENVVKNND